jgi:hypothetical protein
MLRRNDHHRRVTRSGKYHSARALLDPDGRERKHEDAAADCLQKKAIQFVEHFTERRTGLQ